MSIDLSLLNLAGLGIMIVISAATYYRSGGWNSKTEVQSLTATLTTHDERLKTVEKRIAELPTAQAVSDIKHAVEKLDIAVLGKLEGVNMRLTQGEKEGQAQHHQVERELHSQSSSIKRIEQFLLDQAKDKGHA